MSVSAWFNVWNTYGQHFKTLYHIRLLRLQVQRALEHLQVDPIVANTIKQCHADAQSDVHKDQRGHQHIGEHGQGVQTDGALSRSNGWSWEQLSQLMDAQQGVWWRHKMDTYPLMQWWWRLQALDSVLKVQYENVNALLQQNKHTIVCLAQQDPMLWSCVLQDNSFACWQLPLVQAGTYLMNNDPVLYESRDSGWGEHVLPDADQNVVQALPRLAQCDVEHTVLEKLKEHVLFCYWCAAPLWQSSVRPTGTFKSVSGHFALALLSQWYWSSANEVLCQISSVHWEQKPSLSNPNAHVLCSLLEWMDQVHPVESGLLIALWQESAKTQMLPLLDWTHTKVMNRLRSMGCEQQTLEAVIAAHILPEVLSAGAVKTVQWLHEKGYRTDQVLLCIGRDALVPYLNEGNTQSGLLVAREHQKAKSIDAEAYLDQLHDYWYATDKEFWYLYGLIHSEKTKRTLQEQLLQSSPKGDSANPIAQQRASKTLMNTKWL